jgi:hypothetical protein
MQYPAPRKALVVGIGAYQHARKLTTPVHDAAAFGDLLRNDLHFDQVTVLGEDAANRTALVTAIKAFAQTIEEGDLVFVYFSGHGVQRNGADYLVPIEAANPEDDDADLVFVGVDWIWRLLGDRSPGAIVLFLDACRTSAFSVQATDEILALPAAADAAAAPPPPPPAGDGAPASARQGLAQINLPPQILIAFAAEPNRPAYSLFAGEVPTTTSIYTRHVITALRTEPKPIFQVIGMSALRVYEKTGKRQRPFLNAFGPSAFLLLPNPRLEAWEDDNWALATLDADSETQAASLRAFLMEYPTSRYARAGRERLVVLRAEERPHVFGPDTPLTGGAAAPNVLSGAIRSPTFAASVKGLGFANRAITVRSLPNGVLGRAVATLSIDDPMKVLRTRADGWAEVIAPDGTHGWIGKVRETTEDAPALSVAIQYPQTDEPSVVPADWNVASLVAMARADPKATVKIKTGAPANVDASLIGPLTLLRTLRLRQSLVEQGLSPSQVSLQPNAPDLAQDTASVSVYRSGLGQ